MKGGGHNMELNQFTKAMSLIAAFLLGIMYLFWIASILVFPLTYCYIIQDANGGAKENA